MTIEDPIRRGRHAIWECHAHLVFVTKYRRDVLTGDMLDRVEDIASDVCAGFGAELAEFEGEDDHVHLLVKFPATVQLSRLVNSLKGVTSRRLRQEFTDELATKLWGGHLWSRSYYCGTVGGPTIDRVRDYIRSQQRPD